MSAEQTAEQTAAAPHLPAGAAAPARVLGLDLSLTATGICYPDGATATVKTRPRDGDQRLTIIRDRIRSAVGLYAPHLAVLEDLPTHAHSAGITGMVHGVARAALLDARVPYAVVAPATLKAFATGKGNADKTAMAMAAYKRAGVEFTDDNCCDAWWLYVAGRDRLSAPLFPMPAAQRDRLDKVTWPDMPGVAA